MLTLGFPLAATSRYILLKFTSRVVELAVNTRFFFSFLFVFFPVVSRASVCVRFFFFCFFWFFFSFFVLDPASIVDRNGRFFKTLGFSHTPSLPRLSRCCLLYFVFLGLLPSPFRASFPHSYFLQLHFDTPILHHFDKSIYRSSPPPYPQSTQYCFLNCCLPSSCCASCRRHAARVVLQPMHPPSR